MKIRLALGVICLGLFGFLLFNFGGRSRGNASPSIVLIIVDTLRADKLGVYGDPSPASREFDHIARKGVIFENAISQASWTRSSVASMLSGLNPRKTSVIKEKWDALPLSVTTLAEHLKAAGYFTIGLTANPQLNRDFEFHQGFDHYSESTVIFPWMKSSDGKIKADKESPVRSGEEMFREGYRLAEEKSAAAPLYLQLLIMDVHAHHRIALEDVDEDLKPFPEAPYLQAVRRATRPLTEFIEKIDKLLAGDVVFLIVADHGEGLSDHPAVHSSKGHGNLLYRSQVHVPFIVIEGGSSHRFSFGRRSQLTPLVNIVPTVLDLVGAGETGIALDGQSLVANLTNPQVLSEPQIAFTQTEWRPGVKKTAVVTPEWFYIEGSDTWSGTAPVELHPFNGPQNGAGDSLHLENESLIKNLSSQLRNFSRTKP